MAKPGVVLRRPDGPFREHADLRMRLSDDEPKRGSKRSRGKPRKRRRGKIDDKAARKAALAFEREERRRGAERRREEAARQEGARAAPARDVQAQAAFDKTKRVHDKRAAAIEAERGALERRARPALSGGAHGRTHGRRNPSVRPSALGEGWKA
jgi:colicin import membrane protein